MAKCIHSRQGSFQTGRFKRWWVWGLLGSLLLASAGGCKTARSEDMTDVSPTFEPSYAQETTVEAPQEEEPEEIPVETCLAAIESVLTKNYGENYRVELEENQLTIGVWVDGMALSAAAAVAGDEDSQAAWDAVMDAMVSLENSFQSVLDDSGHRDIAVLLNVVNDLSTDSVLASITGDAVIYDAVNGIDLYGVAE
jgi:hypothetical protein